MGKSLATIGPEGLEGAGASNNFKATRNIGYSLEKVRVHLKRDFRKSDVDTRSPGDIFLYAQGH